MKLKGTQISFVVLIPPTTNFSLHFSDKFSKFVVSIPAFFWKTSQNFKKKSLNSSNFFKIEKTIIFIAKLVPNHYIDQNLDKFSHNTTKTANFSSKTFFFSKFSAYSPPKIVLSIPQKIQFFVIRVPLVPGSPNSSLISIIFEGLR